MLKKLQLNEIVIDESLQTRISTDPELVSKYADTLELHGEWIMPPITIATVNGVANTLVDGFHRYNALGIAMTNNLQFYGTLIPAQDTGHMTKLGALQFSITNNNQHGKALTRRDKYNAFCILMNEGIGDISNSEFARIIGVTHPTIKAYRVRYADNSVSQCDKSRPYSNTTRKIADTWSIDDNHLLSMIDTLVQNKSTVVNEICDTGGLWAREEFTPLSSGYDAVKIAYEARKTEALSIALQETKASADTLCVVNFDARLIVPDFGRWLIFCQRRDLPKMTQWIKNHPSEIVITDMVKPSADECWVAITAQKSENVYLPAGFTDVTDLHDEFIDMRHD